MNASTPSSPSARLLGRWFHSAASLALRLFGLNPKQFPTVPFFRMHMYGLFVPAGVVNRRRPA